MPTAAALAETLLHEWEARARPMPTPAYQTARAALLARLTVFCTLLLRPDDINVDADDARATLRHATAFRLGQASAAGPGRAGRLGPLLAASLLSFPPTAPLTGLKPIAALLNLQSSAEHDLQMDELTEIVETVQQNILSEDTEMIFGHGLLPETEEAGLLVWLLVGYATEAPAPVAAKPVHTTPTAPDEQGRDPAFGAAASLCVRLQQASSSQLQRELKLGYNRSQRLIDQLAQAGIIGPNQDGNQGKLFVLIATEPALARYLAQLPPLIK